MKQQELYFHLFGGNESNGKIIFTSGVDLPLKQAQVTVWAVWPWVSSFPGVKFLTWSASVSQSVTED